MNQGTLFPEVLNFKIFVDHFEANKISTDCLQISALDRFDCL